MPAKYDSSALWVALSEQSDGDLFSVYPKLLADLLLQEEAARQDGDTSEAEKLVLPSDKEYRLKQYFYMVSLQKASEDDDGETSIAKPAEDQIEQWAPWALVAPTKKSHAPPPVTVKTTPGPVWDIGQVLKAARLLKKPPMEVEFTDEQEMRRVYSIIYDVFRYKTILDQAIEDVEFFTNFPEFAEHHHTTWLFLMELARRRWGARPRGETERATKLLNEEGWPFKDIENEMWQQRVHFAAAIARIRIKNKAFSLAELLPPHLREERISACVNKITVTGWVNTFKAKKVALLVKQLHELGYSYSNSRQLCAGEYRFDRVCPRFITLRPPDNVSIGHLDLVKNGVIVLQEREFCEGASTLCRALHDHALRGVVAQTHASSPRCSAYLAAQLRELAAVLKAQAPAAPITPQLGRLIVFGAGDKVTSYVLALRELGIEASEVPQSDAAVCVISEQVYCETPTVINALDGVVAALATPPNSYSAVTDPIDLVCGRGGDLAMLEVLTESEIDSTGKARVQSILEEQKKTLRTLMSKPQIQLILYETHSALEAENQAQVTRAVAEANRLARERHALLKRKHRQHSPTKLVVDPTAVDSSTTLDTDLDIDHTDDTISNPSPKRPLSRSPDRLSTNRSRPQSEDISTKRRAESAEVASRPGTNKARPIPGLPQPEADAIPRDPDQDNPNIFVPNCDLFEVGTLPNLGNGLDINYILDRDGCYLGLIQRKEVTRLDAKYMIRVAEERGLFGPSAPPPQPQRRKRPDRAPSDSNRRKRKNNGFEIVALKRAVCEHHDDDALPSLFTASTITSPHLLATCGAPSPTTHALSDAAHHTTAHCADAGKLAGLARCSLTRRERDSDTAIVERVAAPTYASLSRSARRASEPTGAAPRACCERHARRHAAAAALSAAACTCDARHRHQYRRASADTAVPPPAPARAPDPPCRRPFPLVVHDVHLKPVITHHKIYAST